MNEYVVKECTPKVVTRRDGSQTTKYMCTAEGVDMPIEFWRFIEAGSKISGTLQETGFNSYRIIEQGMQNPQRKGLNALRNNRSIEKQSARKDAVNLVAALISSGNLSTEKPADLKAHIKNLYDFLDEMIKEDQENAPF